MKDHIQTIAAVIQNLRELFKDKDRLVGVDDWDTFIGILLALQGLANDLQATTAEKTAEE